MDRDDIIKSVARLEAVADRFDKVADLVAAHETRIASLEDSRGSVRRTIAAFVGPIIVGLLLAFLVGKGIKP